MARLDITEQNRAVEQVLEVTENPRHRYLLQSYLRHRYLESAGRYKEIFAPEMTVEHPVYRFEPDRAAIHARRPRARWRPFTATGPKRISASSTSRTRPWRWATT